MIFLQFAKQHSQYKVILSYTVLWQQCWKVCFVSCSSDAVM